MNVLTAYDETSHQEQPLPLPLPSLSEVEQHHIQRVLGEVRWNCRQAAKILGISRWSLARRIRKYGMHRPGREQHA